MELPWFALRTVAAGLLIYAMSRYLPRRSGSGLAAYDFVFFWMMGGLAVAPLYDLKIRLADTVAAVIAIFVSHWVLSGIALSDRRWASWLSGNPVPVIEGGIIHEARMKKALLPLEILLSELRTAGISRTTEVETAILETTGHLSVVKKTDYLPVTAGSLQKGEINPPLPLVLVADGKIIRSNLNQLGADEKWLHSQLAGAEALKPEYLYIAVWEGTEPIYWVPKSN